MPKNSILFITTKEKFRIPDYIALRFNLQITWVHRGILLGTGPLVDPGFEGYLLIPLHNLTSNDYYLTYDEQIIWVEFTKISPNPKWIPSSQELVPYHHRTGQYIEFKRTSKIDDPWAYLDKARHYHPYVKRRNYGMIANSIPEEVQRAQDDAQTAKIYAKEAKETSQNMEVEARKIQWVGIIGIGVAAIAIMVTLTTGLSQIQAGMTSAMSAAYDRQISLEGRIDALERELSNDDRKPKSDQVQPGRSDTGQTPAPRHRSK